MGGGRVGFEIEECQGFSAQGRGALIDSGERLIASSSNPMLSLYC